MFLLFKIPTYITTAFGRTSHHVGTTNYCRKLSTTHIQQGRKGLAQVPMSEDCSSLSELNEKWSKRFQELDAQWSERLKEVDSLCFKCSKELHAMRSERSQKPHGEKEGESLKSVSRQLSTTIHDDDEKDLKRLNQFLTIRAAVENVINQAKLWGKISLFPSGKQEGLDELAKRKEFTKILENQVEERGLNAKKVMAAFHRLESLVSKPPSLAGLTVTVPFAGFKEEERAALVILFKVQEKWLMNFKVEEEEKPDDDSDSGSVSESLSDDSDSGPDSESQSDDSDSGSDSESFSDDSD